MFKILDRKTTGISAGFIAGMMLDSSSAHAGTNFSDIAQNIVESIQSLPGLLTALAYMFGIVLAALGAMKIKDHVGKRDADAIERRLHQTCGWWCAFRACRSWWMRC